MNLIPVGRVRSKIKDRKDMPPLGVPASVEIFPEFADALLKLEKHSHLWVLGWLDQTGRDALQVTPRGVRGFGPDELHGVFAVRSPTRPNPIGLSAARILRRKGRVIRLDRLDFSDGTAVVDLKPYLATRDLLFCARNAQIGRPKDEDAVRASLRMQVENFCGELPDEKDAPDFAVAIEVMTHFRTEVLDFTDPEEWRITVPIHRRGVIAAVMAMTRTLPEFHTIDAIRFRHDSAFYEYELNEDGFRFYPY
jgi:tRNA-Thr(GGU) m(6)t(6)A37 methyltransferase TsaA